MSNRIEIEITPELLAAAKRRRFLLENASDLENLPSEVWNRDYTKSTLALCHEIQEAILKAEARDVGNNPPN